MGFTEMEKSPFTSAVTPLVVPGTMTDAPGSALPAASTTLPLTTSDCAETADAAKSATARTRLRQRA